jgi:hypothetical protein
MSEMVTVELPDEIARRVRAVAAHSNRRFEEVLVDWIDRATVEPTLELLPDDQLLSLCDSQLDTERQEELSELLTRNREGQLQEAERSKLDELMLEYRRGLLRKAQALRIAVGRGLRSRLS